MALPGSSSSGSTIKPAPCAVAIRHDQMVRPDRVTRIPPKRGWRWRIRRRTPSPTRSSATVHRSTSGGNHAAGGRGDPHDGPDRHRMADGQRRERSPHGAPTCCSCRPSATANSQPMPGLMPWKAPSPATSDQRSPRCRLHVHGLTQKQNESDEASPPSRRTWCGRSASNSRKKLRVERQAAARGRRPASSSSRGRLRDRTARPRTRRANW